MLPGRPTVNASANRRYLTAVSGAADNDPEQVIAPPLIAAPLLRSRPM